MKALIIPLAVLAGLAGAWLPEKASAQVREVQFDNLKPYFSKHNDTLYVVNFWATWCGPCVKELPYFEKLNQEFAERPVAVLLVSLDFSRNLNSKVIPFVRRRDLQSQVLFLHQPRGHEWMNHISRDWSGAIPATYIIRNDRKKASFYEQTFDDYSSLLDAVKPHL